MLEQIRRKIDIVVFDGQVQSIAVLEFDVISPDAGEHRTTIQMRHNLQQKLVGQVSDVWL